jgi:hypothetical protein
VRAVRGPSGGAASGEPAQAEPAGVKAGARP